MTITREQVERAMDAAYDCNAQGVNAALGAEWYKDPRIPSDVLAGWRETGYTSLYRALTRWRDELVAAEPIDDTAPERLRERRERADAAQAARMQRDAADYAAALSAAEAERPAKPDPLAYADSPAWDDWPMPKPVPALEMVDVPQPIVKRCACSDIHDDVEATWQSGEPYLTVTHTTVPLALLRAMLEAIDAQQGGA